METTDPKELLALSADGRPVPAGDCLLISIRFPCLGIYCDTVENCLPLAMGSFSETSKFAAHLYREANIQVLALQKYLEDTKNDCGIIMNCDAKMEQHLHGTVAGNGTYFHSDVSKLSRVNSPMGGEHGRKFKMFKTWVVGKDIVQPDPELMTEEYLVKELASRGCDTTGSKTDLVQRLNNELRSEAIAPEDQNADFNWQLSQSREILRREITHTAKRRLAEHPGIDAIQLAERRFRKRNTPSTQQNPAKRRRRGKRRRGHSVHNLPDGSSAAIELDPIDIKKMKKSKLQAELRKRGRSGDGKLRELRSELIDLIREEESPLQRKYKEKQIEQLVQEIHKERLHKIRLELAALGKHGVTGEACLMESSFNSLDPLHGYSIIYLKYLHCVFKFAKDLAPSKHLDGSLGSICEKMLQKIGNRSREHTKSTEWLSTNGPKFIRQWIDDETIAGEIEKEPRLSGKGSKDIGQEPTMYLACLLDSMSEVHCGKQVRKQINESLIKFVEDSNGSSTNTLPSITVGARVEATSQGWTKYYTGTILSSNNDGTFDIMFDNIDTPWDHLKLEDQQRFSYLLLYGTMLSVQMACIQSRYIPCVKPTKSREDEEEDYGLKVLEYKDKMNARWQEMQQNLKSLRRVNYIISVVENCLLFEVTCHYTIRFNVLSHEYGEHFLQNYNCSLGLWTCQTMERLNCTFNYIIAFRRRRGCFRRLKNGGIKNLLSTYQQQFCKFYYMNVYGNILNPKKPSFLLNSNNHILDKKVG